MKYKLAKTLFPSVKFKIGREYTDHGKGDEWREKYQPAYDKLIQESFRFNYILEDDLDLDENLTIKQAIEKIESDFLNNCILYFNFKDVDDSIKPFGYGRNIKP